MNSTPRCVSLTASFRLPDIDIPFHSFNPISKMSTPPPRPADPAAQAQTSHHELLSSERRPTTDAVLTVRVIKSFEFRTQKSLVLKGVNLETETVGGLMERVRNGQSESPSP